MKKAIVLLSGGLDSAVLLKLAKREGFRPHALTFSYGQLHKVEINSARSLVKHEGIEHTIIDLDPKLFKNSALTGNGEVPKNRSTEEMSEAPTYVPARNTIFLSYALSLAESLQAYRIYIGVNALDYAGYPDCRPEYISAFNKVAKLGTNEDIEIVAPLINLTKAQIISVGNSLGVPFEMTISCYIPKDTKPCGECDACTLRRLGFEEVNR